MEHWAGPGAACSATKWKAGSHMGSTPQFSVVSYPWEFLDTHHSWVHLCVHVFTRSHYLSATWWAAIVVTMAAPQITGASSPLRGYEPTQLSKTTGATQTVDSPQIGLARLPLSQTMHACAITYTEDTYSSYPLPFDWVSIYIYIYI